MNFALFYRISLVIIALSGSLVPVPALTAKNPCPKIPVYPPAAVCCAAKLPNRFGISNALPKLVNDLSKAPSVKRHAGMVWVNAGTYCMGGYNALAPAYEFPKHKVNISR